MVQVIRPWTDGKPYYCIVCGLGRGEYMACEEGCCQLESEEEARKRMTTSQRPGLKHQPIIAKGFK